MNGSLDTHVNTNKSLIVYESISLEEDQGGGGGGEEERGGGEGEGKEDT